MGLLLTLPLSDRAKVIALESAARAGDRKSVELILTAKVDKPNPAKALIGAVEIRHQEIVEMLLSQGADPNIPYHESFQPTSLLHVACEQGDPPTVQALLAHGADVHAKDFRGRTPLDVTTDDSVATELKQHLGENVTP